MTELFSCGVYLMWDREIVGMLVVPRVLPGKFGGGGQHLAQNPHPIYVQNNWKPAPFRTEYTLLVSPN